MPPSSLSVPTERYKPTYRPKHPITFQQYSGSLNIFKMHSWKEILHESTTIFFHNLNSNVHVILCDFSTVCVRICSLVRVIHIYYILIVETNKKESNFCSHFVAGMRETPALALNVKPKHYFREAYMYNVKGDDY